MRWIGMLLVVGIAGCGGGEYNSRTARGGGGGLPVMALQPSNETVVPPGRGPTLGLAVRSFVPGPTDWVEVAGATCTVTATPYFEATLVTPAQVTLPDLGPDAPPLRAECRTATHAGAAVVSPSYSWPVDGEPSAATRFWWGGGWWWGMEKTGPLSYADLAVGMRSTTAK